MSGTRKKRARAKPTARRRVASRKASATKKSSRRRPTTRAKRKRSTGAAAKPRLRVVRPRRPAPRPRPAPPAESFPQRHGASAKQLVLFEMIRARAAVLAAIHGLTPAAANAPMGEGRWSARETVLHLVTRDQARLQEFETTLRGQTASWQGLEDPEMRPINEDLMAPLRPLDWEEAVRQLHRSRSLLMEAVETVPDEPEEVWSQAHAFGWMLHALSPHDRHHAEVIKRWRTKRGV